MLNYCLRIWIFISLLRETFSFLSRLGHHKFKSEPRKNFFPLPALSAGTLEKWIQTWITRCNPPRQGLHASHGMSGILLFIIITIHIVRKELIFLVTRRAHLTTDIAFYTFRAGYIKLTIFRKLSHLQFCGKTIHIYYALL